jgi:hypothetical protein
MQVSRRALLAAAGVLGPIVLALAGCASSGLAGTGADSSAAGRVSSPPAGAQLSASASGAQAAPQAAPQPVGGGGLVVVRDPGQVTGTLAGPCHASDNGNLPDPRCTPGGIDPAVTQANIHSTICTPGYTTTVRPPEAQTEAFKYDDAYPAYGVASSTQTELDHLVPLELGGDNDEANLWPEVPPSPNPKDSVEDELNRAVCDGQITLASAQIAIAQDWETAESRLGLAAVEPAGKPPAQTPVPAGKPPAQTPAPAPAGGGLSCTASVSSSSPADYTTVDIAVNTAAGASVAAVAHYKTTDHQMTAVASAAGQAEVAYYISGATPGYTVDVDVTVSAGSKTATCATAFTPVS